MSTYRISYRRVDYRICLVEADDEQAARFACLNGDWFNDDHDFTDRIEVVDIQEFDG